MQIFPYSRNLSSNTQGNLSFLLQIISLELVKSSQQTQTHYFIVRKPLEFHCVQFQNESVQSCWCSIFCISIMESYGSIIVYEIVKCVSNLVIFIINIMLLIIMNLMYILHSFFEYKYILFENRRCLFFDIFKSGKSIFQMTLLYLKKIKLSHYNKYERQIILKEMYQ